MHAVCRNCELHKLSVLKADDGKQLRAPPSGVSVTPFNFGLSSSDDDKVQSFAITMNQLLTHRNAFAC